MSFPDLRVCPIPGWSEWDAGRTWDHYDYDDLVVEPVIEDGELVSFSLSHWDAPPVIKHSEHRRAYQGPRPAHCEAAFPSEEEFPHLQRPTYTYVVPSVIIPYHLASGECCNDTTGEHHRQIREAVARHMKGE